MSEEKMTESLIPRADSSAPAPGRSAYSGKLFGRHYLFIGISAPAPLYIYRPAPGPSGRPRYIHITSSSVQLIRKKTE